MTSNPLPDQSQPVVQMNGEGTISIRGGFWHRVKVAWLVLRGRPIRDSWGFDHDTAVAAIAAVKDWEASKA